MLSGINETPMIFSCSAYVVVRLPTYVAYAPPDISFQGYDIYVNAGVSD